jgi:carbonic anhydrase
MNNKLKSCFAWLGLIIAQPVFAAATSSPTPGSPSWAYPAISTTTVPDAVPWSQTVDTTTTLIPQQYPYSECGIGTKQSPVDVNNTASNPNLIATNALNNIIFAYNPIPLSIVNNGHTIQVQSNPVAPGMLFLGNDSFTLIQYHLHAPSEHTLNGNNFPMEIHFVHSTPDGKIAVVGVVVVSGTANAELQTVLDNAPASSGNATNVNITLNPNNLLPANQASYITYGGSLTTPPCSEGVNWYILTNFIQASPAQITAFQKLMWHGTDSQGNPVPNVRNTNNINGRIINIKQ